MLFGDLQKKELTSAIEVLWPRWQRGDERVAILSPHDDDAIIGAGYSILAAQRHGGVVFILIFSRGEAGYSRMADKPDIVRIRHSEAVTSYGSLGIPEDHIIDFEYSDFSVQEHVAWKLAGGGEGSFRRLITFLRHSRITRVVIPNDYREHIDHTAVFTMGSYFTPQAGDTFCVDWAPPHRVRSVLQYSVWADFAPDDALVRQRPSSLRADRAVVVQAALERKIRRGIAAYRSQGAIIKSLVAAREARNTGNGYIELYRTFDPRPKLDFKPYIRLLHQIRSGRISSAHSRRK